MPINRVTIVGNLTRDPELRGLPSGGSVCSLRVAVNERRKNPQTGEYEDAPNFLNVSVFGNSADAAGKYLAKGRQVAIDGRLRWREWTDKDGARRESVEIVAQDVQFIGGRDDNQQSGLPPVTQSGGFGNSSLPPRPTPTQPQQADDFGQGQLVTAPVAQNDADSIPF